VGKACDKPRRKLWMNGEEMAPVVPEVFLVSNMEGSSWGEQERETEKSDAGGLVVLLNVLAQFVTTTAGGFRQSCGNGCRLFDHTGQNGCGCGDSTDRRSTGKQTAARQSGSFGRHHGLLKKDKSIAVSDIEPRQKISEAMLMLIWQGFHVETLTLC
jgi:hypothetical protein